MRHFHAIIPSAVRAGPSPCIPKSPIRLPPLPPPSLAPKTQHAPQIVAIHSSARIRACHLDEQLHVEQRVAERRHARSQRHEKGLGGRGVVPGAQAPGRAVHPAGRGLRRGPRVARVCTVRGRWVASPRFDPRRRSAASSSASSGSRHPRGAAASPGRHFRVRSPHGAGRRGHSPSRGARPRPQGRSRSAPLAVAGERGICGGGVRAPGSGLVAGSEPGHVLGCEPGAGGRGARGGRRGSCDGRRRPSRPIPLSPECQSAAGAGLGGSSSPDAPKMVVGAFRPPPSVQERSPQSRARPFAAQVRVAAPAGGLCVPDLSLQPGPWVGRRFCSQVHSWLSWRIGQCLLGWLCQAPVITRKSRDLKTSPLVTASEGLHTCGTTPQRKMKQRRCALCTGSSDPRGN